MSTLHETALATQQQADDKSPLARLSPREREVYEMLAQGLPPREMALVLRISAKTISTYRARVLDKLDLRSTPDVVRFHMERKLAEDAAARQDNALLAAASELLALVRRYASECAECGGTGEVRANSYDLTMTGCGDCEDIRAVIAKATTR